MVEGGAGVPYIFIQQIFPSAVQRILDSSDSAVLQVCEVGNCWIIMSLYGPQNGGECVRAFVSAAVEQLASWYVIPAYRVTKDISCVSVDLQA